MAQPRGFEQGLPDAETLVFERKQVDARYDDVAAQQGRIDLFHAHDGGDGLQVLALDQGDLPGSVRAALVAVASQAFVGNCLYFFHHFHRLPSAGRTLIQATFPRWGMLRSSSFMTGSSSI